MYVKCKNAYKIKLMVLNGRLFLASPCGCSHDTRFDVADGVNVVCHCVSIAVLSLPTILSLVMLNYHCHSGLMYGSLVMLHYHRHSGLVYGSLIMLHYHHHSGLLYGSLVMLHYHRHSGLI